MNREQMARAIGAAIAQRKLMTLQDLEKLKEWRRAALAPANGVTENVTESIDRFINSDVRPSAERKPAPDVVPPSVQGANIATAASKGSGESWEPGVGAKELAKHLMNEIDQRTPAFEGAPALFFLRYARHFRP